MYSECDATCWRCKEGIGDMIHIWWACPRIKEFGAKIYSECVLLLNLLLNFLPRNCLLYLDFNLSKHDTVLINNLLVAAKILIAKTWKTVVIQTVYEWCVKCQFLLLMNKLNAIPES